MRRLREDRSPSAREIDLKNVAGQEILPRPRHRSQEPGGIFFLDRERRRKGRDVLGEGGLGFLFDSADERFPSWLDHQQASALVPIP